MDLFSPNVCTNTNVCMHMVHNTKQNNKIAKKKCLLIAQNGILYKSTIHCYEICGDGIIRVYFDSKSTG